MFIWRGAFVKGKILRQTGLAQEFGGSTSFVVLVVPFPAEPRRPQDREERPG
jgi:hypothetical protein